MGFAQLKSCVVLLLLSISFIFMTVFLLFQVDVLEVQYAVLMKSLSRARDFESVRRAHDVFLSSLTQDCFLLHKVRMYQSLSRVGLHAICQFRIGHSILREMYAHW